MVRQQSIGIFDSGVGGLSIARAIKHILPQENLVYFADIAFSPYGNKSKNTIEQRTENITNFLIEQNCKMIVVACNTATVNSVSNLRSKFSIPIVGVEPAIKPAALQSKSGVIGVLATAQTLQSDSFAQLKAKHANKVRIEEKACPQFVSLVENLEYNNEQAIEVAEHYIRPLLSQGCDQLVLGCTHFSFLTATIKKIVGAEVNIIDTATPVAMELKRKLHSHNFETLINEEGTVEFWSSANSKKVTESISQLWGKNIKVIAIDSLLP